ncbi:hypothetical protein Tco_0407515 [Tanacetum coccineum]
MFGDYKCKTETFMKLEKKGGSRIHKLKRLYKVGSSRGVESSVDEGLSEEDASKQGRKIGEIDADEGITFITTPNFHQCRLLILHNTTEEKLADREDAT